MEYVFHLRRPNGPVKKEDLGELKRLAERWNQRAGDFWALRQEIDRRRSCVWTGQSMDGMVWEEFNKRNPPVFDGQSDLRLRWADRETLDKDALMIGSLMLAGVNVTAVGRDPERSAACYRMILDHCRRSMGAAWWREWMALTDWVTGDSPAVAMMSVNWVSEPVIEARKMTARKLRGMWEAQQAGRARQGGAPEIQIEEALAEAGRSFDAFMEGDDGEKEKMVPVVCDAMGCDEDAARDGLDALREEGEGEFLCEARGEEGVQIRARRFGNDFVVPDNVTDFEGEGCWFITEWITLDRLETSGWDSGFIESVKAQDETPVLEDSTFDAETVTPGMRSGEEAQEGKRQIVWAYVTAVDAKGRKCKCVCCFGKDGEKTAFGWKVIPGEGGKWPCVLFTREVKSRFRLDSRGIVELVSPSEGIAKTIWDGAADNAQIGNLPSVIAKGFNARNQKISPLSVISMNVNEDIKFMQPPAYPAGGMRVADVIETQVLDYIGKQRKESDAGTVANRRRMEVGWFLSQAADVYKKVVECARDNMSDEELAAVIGPDGNPGKIRRGEIEGTFRVEIELNPEDMDTQNLVERAKAFAATVINLDKNGIIDPSPLVASVTRHLFPDAAMRAIRSAGAGQEDELKDEAGNLESIRAGIMPRMNTEGMWNYAARLDFYAQLQQQNPNVFDDMGQDKRQMLQEWMKALAQQQRQFGENRAIGQTGTAGVGS